MATERLRRRVEQLLDEAEEAISQHNWEVVRGHAQSVLALDPANADGLALIEAAERAAANSSGPQPSSTPDAIESAEQPTSFSGGRYQVKRFLGEGGRTRFYGLFADPVEHLRTPGVLNELIDSRGLDAVVLPMHVTPEHLAEAVAGIRLIRNFPGFMVSIPHKSAVAELCDDLLPNARACGVVNAVL